MEGHRVPRLPKLYHITHQSNLPSILSDGGLVSDALRLRRQLAVTEVGMSSIKQSRLTRPVGCHPGTCVGDYVPFYFCPRSVMLYLLHCSNHPELTYRGGQTPLLHLQADLNAVMDWADREDRRWAFTYCNANAGYARFFRTRHELARVDWPAVASTNFSAPEVKEGKQAEFLMHERFPWSLIERVGVHNQVVHGQVAQELERRGVTTAVHVERTWYY